MPETFMVDHATDPIFGLQLEGGPFELTKVHDRDACRGPHCVIHNPSDHHMRDWPLNWRADRQLMERTCPHGVGHPDPDTLGDGIHACDMCCVVPD